MLSAAVHERAVLVFRPGAVLQQEGFDAGIGEGAPGDLGDMVIVILCINSSCPSYTRGYGARYSGPGVVKSRPSLMLPWPLWGKFGSDGFPGSRFEAVSSVGQRRGLSRASRSQRCCIWDPATN